MAEFFKQLFEAIKLSPRYLLALAFASGFILFGNDPLIQQFGLTDVRDDYRSWLGVVFLLSVSLLVFHGVVALGKDIIFFLHHIKFALQLKKRLCRLTNNEKDILIFYIANQTRSQYLEFTDGVVAGLEDAGIIHKATTASLGIEWAYNIHPRAWRYLNKYPKFVIHE